MAVRAALQAAMTEQETAWARLVKFGELRGRSTPRKRATSIRSGTIARRAWQTEGPPDRHFGLLGPLRPGPASALEWPCLPDSGTRLVVVGVEKGNLAFRVFDARGRKVIDRNEANLPDQKPALDALRAMVQPLWETPAVTTERGRPSSPGSTDRRSGRGRWAIQDEAGRRRARAAQPPGGPGPRGRHDRSPRTRSAGDAERRRAPHGRRGPARRSQPRARRVCPLAVPADRRPYLCQARVSVRQPR